MTAALKQAAQLEHYQRIMRLIDSYAENQTSNNRHAIRSALIELGALEAAPQQEPAGYVTAIEEGKVLMLPRQSLDTASIVPLYAGPQQEPDKLDAERYRWLRSRVPGGAYRIMGVIYSEGGTGVDEAIDAARKAQP